MSYFSLNAVRTCPNKYIKVKPDAAKHIKNNDLNIPGNDIFCTIPSTPNITTNKNNILNIVAKTLYPENPRKRGILFFKAIKKGI